MSHTNPVGQSFDVEQLSPTPASQPHKANASVKKRMIFFIFHHVENTAATNRRALCNAKACADAIKTIDGGGA